MKPRLTEPLRCADLAARPATRGRVVGYARRSPRLLCALALASLLGGCWSKPPATQPATQATSEGKSEPASPVLHTVLSPNARPLVYRLITPDDPPLDPDAPVMVHLDVYDIASAAGTISRDPAFAALVSRLPLPEADTLLRNGIRVGSARQDRWDDFRKVFERYPVKTRPTTIIGTSGRAELMVRQGVPSQSIFHIDAQGQLIGRTYDGSDNFWAARFNPVPHAAGTTQISLTPVVRAMRKRVEISRGSELQINYVQPESLFDLSINAQVPRGDFLIVWPTAEAVQQTTSLASAFLLSTDEGQQLEHIYILSPRVYLFSKDETQKLADPRPEPPKDK